MKQSSLSNYLGSTLIEIMVSLCLAMLLITALITHYLFAKKQYHQVQHRLEHVLELQFIEDLLRNSIHRAGFTPCVNLERLMTNNRNQERLVSIKINFGEYQALEIYRMSEYFDQVLAIPSPNHLLITQDNSYKKSQWILIADCYHAEVQQISSIYRQGKKTVLILKQALRFNYDLPAYIGEWIEESFFVKPNRFNEPALYYKHGHAEELTPHIQNLSAKLLSNQGKKLIKIYLETSFKPLAIDAMVRS